MESPAVASSTGRPGEQPDLTLLAGGLRDAHDRVLQGEPDARIRPEVAASWRRALAAGIDPDGQQPARFREVRETLDLRRGHVLAPYIPVLQDLLADESSGAGHLVVVTDVSGEVLWRLGSRDALRVAERIEFVEGANWSETGIGTNAISHALVHGRPSQMLTGEHLVRTHHDWVCTAVPIRHARTREVVGVLDVSSPLALHSAGVWPMVRMGARLLEELMRSDLASAPAESAPVPTSVGERWFIGPFGPGRPTIRPGAGGRAPALTLRRAEILALLSSRPHGWSADELATALYGDDGVTSSVRAEVHRIRAVLGDAVTSHPYRLVDGEVDSDLGEVRRALAGGDVSAAVAAYTGRLLPTSGNREVGLLRDELHEALRRSVLASGRTGVLRAWVDGPGADDVEALGRLLPLLPQQDSATAVLAARLHRLDLQLGHDPRR